MVQNSKKIAILKTVANGASLAEAATIQGISEGRARNLLNRICRELKMPSSIKEIRSNPQDYSSKIEEIKQEPQPKLRGALIHKLVLVLKLNNPQEVTPQYLSNITASQLLNRDITMIAIIELQQWLSIQGLSLKKQVPKTESEVKAVKGAITILEIYGFDVKAANNQLSHLINGS
jgi:transposase